MVAFYLRIYSVVFSQKYVKSTHQNLDELAYMALTLRQNTCLFVVGREATLQKQSLKKKPK